MAKQQAKEVRIEPSSIIGSGDFSRSDAKFAGWVNVTLTDTQKSQFEDWTASENWGDYLAAHEQLGITHTIKWQPEENCFLAKAYMADPKHVSGGFAVTMRAKDPSTALARVVYVVETILGTDWKRYAVTKKPTDW